MNRRLTQTIADRSFRDQASRKATTRQASLRERLRPDKPEERSMVMPAGRIEGFFAEKFAGFILFTLKRDKSDVTVIKISDRIDMMNGMCRGY